MSTILISVPVLLPFVGALGYDALWFGVFVTVISTIGLVGPPVGLTVFAIQSLPFVVADFALVALLVLPPELAVWLPPVSVSDR